MPRPSATQRPLACQLSLFPETPGITSIHTTAAQSFALGRDYYDCPVKRGVLKGSGYQKQFVYMRVSEQ